MSEGRWRIGGQGQAQAGGCTIIDGAREKRKREREKKRQKKNIEREGRHKEITNRQMERTTEGM